MTIRSRLSRSVTAPAIGANSSGGSHWKVAASATRNASSVSEATSSGPAARAKPSPRLVNQDDGNSQRNPTPSRDGATNSASRPTIGRA